MKRSGFAVFLLLVLTSIALRDYLWPGAFTSHDFNTHTVRIAQYYIGLSDGHFPVRWAKNLVSGLGSPIFVYIYPLPYLLGSFVYLLVRDFEHAAKLVMGTSFIASGSTMYWFLRQFSDRKAALLGALFYTWAPYRFSLLFVRGAYAENLAYVFIPVSLLMLYRLSRKVTAPRIAFGVLAIAAIFLSHNLVAVMAAPIIVAATIWFALHARHRSSYIAASLATYGLSIALTAFILFPDIWEKQHANFNNLRYFDAHLVAWWQLIRSRWDYGFSMLGYEKDAMSFQIGLAHFGAVLVVVWLLLKKRVSRIKKGLAWGCLGLAALITFLMIDNPVTVMLWKTFSFMQIVDFPWRLLGIVTLLVAIAVGVSAKHAPKTIVVMLLLALLLANRNHLRINEPLTFPAEYYLHYIKDTTATAEFMPPWRDSIQEDVRFTERVTVERGNASLRAIEHRSQRLTFVAQASSSAVLRINILYFPGWHVYLDGRPLKIHEEASITSRDPRNKVDTSGMMHFELPAGQHFVDMRFERTPVRLAGDLVSLLGFIIVAGLLSLRNGRFLTMLF